jgi:chemotaxis protein CheC
MTTEITPITEVERDALCELANLAMARAAASIRRMIGRQILLTVPTCEILAPEGALERVVKPGNSNLVAVRQDFSGAFPVAPC